MRFSIEAEQSVIGGLLINPNKLDDVLDVICADDFYRVDHKAIFEAMVFSHNGGKAIDVVLVADVLEASGELERCGGIGYLIELHNNTPAAQNVMAYARVVADRAMERKITLAGQRICELGENPELQVDEKLNQLHAEFAELERNDNAALVTDFDQLLKGQVQDIDERFNNKRAGGLLTGFKSIDDRFGGIEPDDLWILAARPSMGKTTLAMNIAEYVSRTKEVLVFSCEMGKEQLTKRILSSASSVPYNILRSGKLQEHNWPNLSAGVQKLKGRKIHIIDIASIDINRAMAIARKFGRSGNLGLIVVDYLQLMTAKSEGRFDEVSQVSRGLKAIAKTVKAPVLALSQLSRKCEERNNKRPNNSDLRESGQIEQDADIISFIYRDEVYIPDSNQKGIAEIITSKFRNGETGTDFLKTVLQFSRFEDADFVPQQSYEPVRSRGFNG